MAPTVCGSLSLAEFPGPGAGVIANLNQFRVTGTILPRLTRRLGLGHRATGGVCRPQTQTELGHCPSGSAS